MIFRFELKAYCSAPSRVHTTSSTPESWMSRTLTRKTSRREYIRNLKQKDERSHRISFRALVPRTSQCIEAHSSAHQSSASVLVFLLTREPCPSTLAQLPQVVHENRARLLAGSFEGVITARALQHKLRRGGGGGGERTSISAASHEKSHLLGFGFYQRLSHTQCRQDKAKRNNNS